MTRATAELINSIATPENDRNKIAALLKREKLMRGVARLGAFLGRTRKKPIRLGNSVLVMRHKHISEALKRDTDFLNGPLAAERMKAVDFSFVLGMDRGPQMVKEQLALYTALSKIDLAKLRYEAAIEADRIISLADGAMDAIQDFAWPICAATTQKMFGISGMDSMLFREVVRSIFYHIFLNVGGKEDVIERAKKASALLNQWFTDEIGKRRKAGPAAYGDDFLGQLLRLSDDDDQVRRTMGGMLVGSIDTICGATARTLAVLDRHPKLRKRMVENLARPDILKHYYLEATRLWAQTPAMSRIAAHDTVLGGTKVKKDQKLILMIHAGMYDSKVFDDPNTMRCDRPSGAYLHYAAGVHACAGRAMANLQVPMMVGKLLERNYRVTGKFQWAGPFPNRLPIELD